MASADCRTRTPSAISRVSHRPRSCRSSVTIRPSAIEPRRAPGVVQEHQREQPSRLRLVGGEGELAGEPDRLGGKVDATGVARRVDEVEHPEHDGEVARPVEPAPTQAALGAADPLRHRGLRDVEGVRDLAGGEAADGAQRQCHLGRGREVRMTAAAEHEEGVVALLRGRLRHVCVGRLLAAMARGVAATSIDEPPHGDGRQPRVRVARRVLRARPGAPRGGPPAARPRRRGSPRRGGRVPPGPAGRGRAARPRPAGDAVRRSRRVSPPPARRT
jgi:hypothetical protein